MKATTRSSLKKQDARYIPRQASVSEMIIYKIKCKYVWNVWMNKMESLKWSSYKTIRMAGNTETNRTFTNKNF